MHTLGFFFCPSHLLRCAAVVLLLFCGLCRCLRLRPAAADIQEYPAAGAEQQEHGPDGHEQQDAPAHRGGQPAESAARGLRQLRAEARPVRDRGERLKDDVVCALEMFNEDYVTFPRDDIAAVRGSSGTDGG